MKLIRLMVKGLDALEQSLTMEALTETSKIRRTDTDKEKMRVMENVGTLYGKATVYGEISACLQELDRYVDN